MKYAIINSVSDKMIVECQEKNIQVNVPLNREDNVYEAGNGTDVDVGKLRCQF